MSFSVSSTTRSLLQIQGKRLSSRKRRRRVAMEDIHIRGLILWPVLGLLLVLFTPGVQASPWDPHVFPNSASDGAFSEVWYLRAVLPERNESVAVFCGSGVVASNGTEEVMPIYVAILHGDPSTGKTFVYERLAKDLGAVSVTHMGRQVTEKPTWDAPPAMRWALHEETQVQGKGVRAEEEREVAVLSTMGDLAVVRFEADGAVVKMVVKVTPWSYDGRVQPHSWTDVIDGVPLHWYAHSLTSTLLSLDLTTPDSAPLSYHPHPTTHKRPPHNWDLPALAALAVPGTGASAEKGVGLVHLEKNWGGAYPTAWIWTQAFMHTPHDRSNSSTSAQAGLRGGAGMEEEGVLAVTLSWGVAVGSVYAHLVYVRDSALGLAWDFKPTNSRVTNHTVQACDGKVHFVVTNRAAGRELELTVTQPPGSAGPLRSPTQRGFVRMCTESFHATATVTLRQKGVVLRDRVQVPMAALEFGGGMVCKQGAAVQQRR